MEMIEISVDEYEKMVRQVGLLQEIEKMDVDLVRQFRDSLGDVKLGKNFRAA